MLPCYEVVFFVDYTELGQWSPPGYDEPKGVLVIWARL